MNTQNFSESVRKRAYNGRQVKLCTESSLHNKRNYIRNHSDNRRELESAKEILSLY